MRAPNCRKTCCVLFVLALIGCDGTNEAFGPSPVTVPEPPGGVWIGQAESDNFGVGNASAIISEDNQAHFFLGHAHQAGMLTVSGDTISATLAAYSGPIGPFVGSQGVEAVEFAGTVRPRNSITATYSAPSDSGRVDLFYNSVYEEGSELSRVTGIWVFRLFSAGGGSYVLTFDIAADGSVFGTDTAGCVYAGRTEVIDKTYNAYRMRLSVSSCGDADGRYTGLASIIDIPPGEQNALLLGAASSTFAMEALFGKN